MKTRKSTISRSERSSPDRIGTLTNSRNSREASLAGQPDRPSADDSAILQSPICNLQSQRGIALVITLILLAVTLVMAVAFLAISRRERNSVSTAQDAATAKFAADSAQARAIARIVTQMEMKNNPYIFSLLVSTNYINQNGFTNGSADLANVNYDHYVNSSTPLSPADFAQNIANLYYNPRPPVFYSNDFRFYLDLNRNGRYDPSGLAVTNLDDSSNGLGTVSIEVGDPEWIGILAHPDQPHGPNNPFIARYCFIAVPANSADLNYIHNQALNLGEKAVGEGAGDPPGAGVDGYSRDQGVGTWEVNLAAFLADLNTNRWDPLLPGATYTYPEGPINGTGFGASVAFDDARALVAWRYHDYYPLLANADTLFGGPAGWGDFAFKNSGIDYYSLGQQYTFDTNFYGNGLPYGAPSYGNPNTPWLGAPQTNDYFSSPSELFNVSRSDLDFVTNLYSAGTNYSTYDRYTFYRMLGQLGTDTQPASGKINLNYQNAILGYDVAKGDVGKYGAVVANIVTNITIVPNYETNFVSWSPHDFFTAAADRLLRTYTTQWFEESPSNYMQTYYGYYGNNIAAPISGFTSFTNLDGMNVTNVQFLGQTNQIPYFTITNIPVYVNGAFVYTPAVNRLLQLAANIYDASTNTSTVINSNYPSVFRPVFYKAIERNYFLNEVFTNVYIKGYEYVSNAASGIYDPMFATPMEVNDPRLVPLVPGYAVTNVWGVPWILGAKKGLPNLNQMEVENCFSIERLMQMQKHTVDPATMYATNQMYIMSITNYFGAVDTNSYAESYNNPVAIVANDNLSVGLTWTNRSESVIPPVNNPGQGSSFVNAIIAYTNINLQPWSAASSVMMFGTNVYSYTLSIPGGSALEGNSLETAIMNSSDPAYLGFATNSTSIYYYGPKSVTIPSAFGTFTFNPPCFIPTFLDPSNYLDQGTPPLPQMTYWVTNRLQAYMVDGTGHILDYVQLGGMSSGMNSIVNLSQVIADDSRGYPYGLWSTNFYQGDEPQGVNQQYLTSQISGSVPPEDADGGKWANGNVPGTTDTGPAAQQAFFSAFLNANQKAPYANAKNGYVQNTLTSMQLPFTPTRTVVQRFVYEANDPLVHYMASDLYDFLDSTNNFVLDAPPLQKLVSGDDRYMPWGNFQGLGNATLYGIPIGHFATPYDYRYRDPLVTSPDYWDFPTNKYPTVGWLGRVHRGTPWQTVYMKSSDILALNGVGVNVGVPTWQLWTGNVYNSYDAINTAPDQDRLLFDIFTAAPNDDAMRGQISVNIGADDPTNMLAGLASWSALFSGSLAFTNNNSGGFLFNFNPPNPPTYGLWTIQPLGPPPYPNGYITNSVMGAIVEGINSTRTNWILNTNTDGLLGVYEHAGDILRVPQLSVQSPLLNWNDSGQEQNGINDEMYEWLPQQIMGLLTVSGTPQNPPRYVIYCYGQTLKPAPNGLVSSGTYFGMCTNYQVTAESAWRAVIEIQNTPTPANPTATPHVVVEQYNPLPPD